MKNLTFKLNQITTATPIIRKNVETHAKTLTKYFFEHGYAESWEPNQFTYYMGIIGHPSYCYSICVNLVDGKADVRSSSLSYNYGYEFSPNISTINKDVLAMVVKDIESIPFIDKQGKASCIKHLQYCQAYNIKTNGEAYQIKPNCYNSQPKLKMMKMDGPDNVITTFYNSGWWLSYNLRLDKFFTWFHVDNGPHKGEFIVDFRLNDGKIVLLNVSYSNSVKEVRDISILGKLIPMLSDMVEEAKDIELDFNTWQWRDQYHKKGYLPVVFKELFQNSHEA